MNYQLVIQFSAASVKEFDQLVDLEEDLRAKIKSPAEIDGHDFGSGEFNIFVLTNDPVSTFGELKSIMSQLCRDDMRVAYRALTGDHYTVLWPPNLKEFTIA